MYVDSSPTAARRSSETSRRRGDCRKPARQAVPTRTPTVSRPNRLDDAIVSQWLLEQVPSSHRRVLSA